LAFPTFRTRSRLDRPVAGAGATGVVDGASRLDDRPEIELDVSVVIPCLDEEETITGCVLDARAAIDRMGLRGEVLVVDNGSRDSSPELAAAAGAIVVHEERRGYGRAYLTGLEHARGRFILLGDGDATYDFDELPRFLAAMEDGADMVLGSRIRGRILPGAMPWHHRWIGNPALTGLLNLLYRTGVSDAHCGLRMVRRSALPRMGLRATGMEFASEMVVKAKLAGLRIDERPITYAPRPGGSHSKLRSLHDGIRHVLYLLAWAPARVFLVPAAAMLAAAGLATGWGPAPGDVVAGSLLAVSGGILAQSVMWLRMYRSVADERSERIRRAVRRAVSPGGLLAVAAAASALVVGAMALADEARRHRLTTLDGRGALALLAGAVVLLAAVAFAIGLRRFAERSVRSA
jgi:hypothetical protein